MKIEFKARLSLAFIGEYQLPQAKEEDECTLTVSAIDWLNEKTWHP